MASSSAAALLSGASAIQSLTSGPNVSVYLTCSNILPHRQENQPKNCPAPTKIFCNCGLVGYCGLGCRLKHWEAHKEYCGSAMSTPGWRPFVSNESQNAGQQGQTEHMIESSFGNFWGKSPAFDFLNLASNEGEDYQGDMAVCFAACEDVRNFVETVAAVPDTYGGRLTLVVNSVDERAAFRNFLILSLLCLSNVDTAVDTIIHLWYSSRLRPCHIDLIREQILPNLGQTQTIQCPNLANQSVGIVLTMGKGDLTLILRQSEWPRILGVLNRWLIPEETEQNRKDYLRSKNNEMQKELLEIRRNLHRRVSISHFRTRGSLLPFGSDDSLFTEPNPTLFDADHRWLLSDALADPRRGWNQLLFMNGSGLNPYLLHSDLYGHLHFYLQRQLRFAHAKLRSKRFAVIASLQAPEHLQMSYLPQTYDRIDASNLADISRIGTPMTLQMMKPLLSPFNKMATLVTLYTHFVATVRRSTGLQVDLQPDRDLVQLDALWKIYMDIAQVHEGAAATAVVMKEINTVIPAWHPGLLTHENPEYKLHDLADSAVNDPERFVEWQLVQPPRQPLQ